MEYRYKIEIEIDDEKVIEEGKYVLESIYDAIRRWFKEEDIPEVKGDEGVLTFASNKTDDKELARFLCVETSLLDQDWFTPYAKRMTWYDTLSGALSTEDILFKFRIAGLI